MNEVKSTRPALPVSSRVRGFSIIVALGIYILCFAIGTLSHALDFMMLGPRPYSWGPPLLEVFWSTLVVLDAMVVILLLAGRLRSGLVLAAGVMLCDVAANAYAAFVLRVGGFDFALPLQAAFLGFVLGSIGFLWPTRT